jgi:hypothetical protein
MQLRLNHQEVVLVAKVALVAAEAKVVAVAAALAAEGTSVVEVEKGDKDCSKEEHARIVANLNGTFFVSLAPYGLSRYYLTNLLPSSFASFHWKNILLNEK